MSGRLRTIITSASALLQLSSAKPTDPTITAAAVLPRQNSDTFIGYVKLNNTWSSLDCESGLTWYQSGQYAQCCPTTEAHCYAPTACVGGSQIYTYSDISSVRTIACTDNYQNAALSICNTIFIFENEQNSNPRTNINCGDSKANWSYYRDIPASETSSVTSVPGVTTSAPVVPTQTPEPESGSKAWIAGAVVGPILGLALVGAGVWVFLRRKKNAALPQHGSASMAPIDPNRPPAGVGGHTDAKPQFHPAQPTYYDRPGQPSPYAQQGHPPQGGFSPPHMSPAPQYGFQSAYNATENPQSGAYIDNVKYEGTGGAAELAGESNGIAGTTHSAPGWPPGAVPVSELSAVDAKRPGEGGPVSNKPQ